MFKRISLFILVNILVILTISISLQVLGVKPYLSKQGIHYEALLIFCAVFGFAGAFISLLLSRFTAKFIMGVQLINPEHPASREEKFLIKTVYRFAEDVGITTMPEVGIYDSNEVNAFATGATKNSALVAVSSGLLNRMDEGAIEGVLAHEVSHISNGDMVTMTLIQGVVNTFVMFFARVAAWIAVNALRKSDDDAPSYFLMYLLRFVFEIILSILGSILVAYFSRIREYAADHGGANLAGRGKMIHALQSLKSTLPLLDQSQQQSIATLKISGNVSRFLKLLATHPDLEDRIARLEGLED